MIELIPAIDIIDGKCVRLTKGDYNRKNIYRDSPVDVAKEFEAKGFRRLHIVDLDGAKSRHIVNGRILEEIKSMTNLVVDFGGGIKTDEDISTAFSCGADMVTIGSVAVKEKKLFLRWLETYGPDRIILGADVRDGFVSVSGWLEDTSLELLPFLEDYIRHEVKNVLCTDISKDGTLSGPATMLYQQVMQHFPTLHLIASGGVSCTEDIFALDEAGIPAVVFGKAYYEGKIEVDRLGI
ncbi:MAG: 1-(5-phosphoribosyl)-5-[Prevotella sp.]|nr:1-(5-phosphoribosyl)-5-[(5-phosphoribosylamino)methylideneamino]imidazole-4-carboxamide isomerase [Prevotella sp.]